MESPEFCCPHCQSTVPPVELNVSTGAARCQGCGLISAAFPVGTISLDCLAEPPRNVSVETGCFDETKITYRRVSPFFWFMIAFMACVGFLCGDSIMASVCRSQVEGGQFDWFLGINLAIGAVMLAAVIVYLALGKWVVTLNRGEGTVFTGVGPLGWIRRFSYNRDSVVSFCLTEVKVNNRPQEGIRVRTDGEDFVFGALLKKDCKQFIAAAILQEVKKMQ